MSTGRPYLLYAYGNPGRLDDGLGPACARRIEALRLPQVTVECDYQLTVEDAWLVSQHDLTIFVDASVDGPAPWRLSPVHEDPSPAFSSHICSPGTVMAAARQALGADPVVFQLAIRGYRFDGFGEELTENARRNLDDAVKMLVDLFEGRRQLP